jgi:hypothetical protein
MKTLSCWLASIAIMAISPASAVSSDATSPASDVCPVHEVKMEAAELRVAYGMPSRLEFEEMRVAKTRFPFGRDYVLGGCVLKPTKTAKGFLCPKCVEARKAWLAEQKH